MEPQTTQLQEITVSSNIYAGRLRKFIKNWEFLTQDPTLLSWIKGYKIPFVRKPNQSCKPKEFNSSPTEFGKYCMAVDELLRKGVLSKCDHMKGEFLSSFFLVPKTDGTYRFILNLKNLNTFICPPHFKLENYKFVSDLITRNSFMATVDLKDAYYMVPISSKYRKYLRFTFNNFLYEYNAMPMGLSTAPYLFTKILKPVFNKFRSSGMLCIVYLDDILVLGKSKDEVLKNIKYITYTLQNLGFIINYKKSRLLPTQSCKYLGFLYNSVSLTISLPTEKINNITSILQQIKTKSLISIKEFSRVIGILVAACPAVQYGWLHIKQLERGKYLSLKKYHGNYNAKMLITVAVRSEFLWWESNIGSSLNYLGSRSFDLEIYSDASKTGWGAVCEGSTTRGFWGEKEIDYHINYLELLAAFYAVKCFASNESNINILLRIDNKTAIAYINKMGGVRFENLNKLTRNIWLWCEHRSIFLRASFIPSKKNAVADFESRSLAVETEYSLNKRYFSKIVRQFGEPNIDLFASKINKKCDIYISWLKDPDSMSTDAFTIRWEKKWYFFAFPPFSIVGRVLKKIIQDKAIGIVVVPHWPTQHWYPLFLKLCIEKPIIFEPNKELLLSPFRTPHPLWKNLSLVVSKLSGDVL